MPTESELITDLKNKLLSDMNDSVSNKKFVKALIIFMSKHHFHKFSDSKAYTATRKNTIVEEIA